MYYMGWHYSYITPLSTGHDVMENWGGKFLSYTTWPELYVSKLFSLRQGIGSHFYGKILNMTLVSPKIIFFIFFQSQVSVNSETACCSEVPNLSSYLLLSNHAKSKTKFIIVPVVLCGCEKRILGRPKETEFGEFPNFRSSPNIISVIR
jgi:hypothetical protein